MKISKLIITEEEKNEAVEQWLKSRCGLDAKVQSVDKNYSSPGYTVELDIPEPKLAPLITTPEQLGEAILANKV